MKLGELVAVLYLDEYLSVADVLPAHNADVYCVVRL
jgi:hypothetical protein